MHLVAGILSLIIPGLGQIKNRQFLKGITIMILNYGIIYGIYYFFFGPESVRIIALELNRAYFFMGVMHLVFSLYASFDAYLFHAKGEITKQKQLEEFERMLEEKEEQKKQLP